MLLTKRKKQRREQMSYRKRILLTSFRIKKTPARSYKTKTAKGGSLRMKLNSFKRDSMSSKTKLNRIRNSSKEPATGGKN